MSSLSPTDEVLDSELLSHHSLHAGEKLWQRVWTWGCDRLNPIVVKEVRQSLKSKQFVISFGLTLIAAAMWTVTIIALLMPRILYLPGGGSLLAGFLAILIIPTMVLIPASAFLSLVSEKQNSTFDLLSISSLSAIQIIHGKMASALVQLMLYLSALAPCMVLTYLMRGVSLSLIVMTLVVTVIISVCETAIALLLASISKTTMLQGVIGVLLLTALLSVGFSWFSIATQEATGLDNMRAEGLAVLFAVLTVVGLAVALALRAAAAAIDFPSENNSTPLRLRILALVSLILFWILVLAAIDQSALSVGWYIRFLFFALLVVGSLVTGELGIISPRAQRGLPRTFLGRMFLTWLYPGAGMGYIFLVCLFAGVVATCIATEIHFSLTTAIRPADDTNHSLLSYLLLCHFTFFTGLNRILMLLFPKHLPNRMLASFAMTAVLIVLAHMLPLLIVYHMNEYRNFPFAWHQSLNFIWTITEASSGGTIGTTLRGSAIVMSILALTVFGLNLVLCTKDLFLVRVAEPDRVRQDKESESPELATETPNPFA